MTGDTNDDRDETAVRSALFIYGAPLVGVLLVSVGIGAAVPGAYDMIQEDLTTCDAPRIAVESAEETERRFGQDPPSTVTRLDFSDLSPDERAAFRRALDDPVGEANVKGASPNRPHFENGTLVSYEGERHYVTLVAENPCFQAAPLQFPLGVFAIVLGLIGILVPPVYRRLVALEESAP